MSRFVSIVGVAAFTASAKFAAADVIDTESLQASMD